MVTFFTDLEADGAGEFLDTAGVGIRYTIGAGTVTPRIFFPVVAPGGSLAVNIYNTSGGLVAGPLTLATTTTDAWNSTTTSPALSAGTYDFIWSTTRYKAISGFFSGGPVTRSGITAEKGRFGPNDNPPTTDSTAAFVVDINWVSSGTTPFTKDVSLQWNVLNSFTKDVSLPWNVLNSFTKDTALQWNVLNAFTKDTSLLWEVLNAFTKDVVLVWDVQSGTGFTKDVVLNWRVFNTITKDVVLSWRVLGEGVITITVWRAGDELPAIIEGIWNGTTVTPAVSVEVT